MILHLIAESEVNLIISYLAIMHNNDIESEPKRMDTTLMDLEETTQHQENVARFT